MHVSRYGLFALALAVAGCVSKSADGAGGRDASNGDGGSRSGDARVSADGRVVGDSGEDARAGGDGSPSSSGDASPRDGGADASSPSVTPDASDAASSSSLRTDGCPTDAPLPLNRVRVLPRTGDGVKLVGLQVQGSNEGPTTGFVDLGTLDSTPADGSFTDVPLPNVQLFRFVRVFDAQGRGGGIAELEFMHGSVKLGGSAFGSVATGIDEHPSTNAFDGNPATYYAAVTAGGNYAGLDIAGSYVTAGAEFSPAPGVTSGPVDISLASATAGAEIRYTTNGDDPSAENGSVYSAPIRLESGRLTLRAIAVARCSFPSKVSSASYGIGVTPVAQGLKSYHIGNSLTDAAWVLLDVTIDSAGVDHTAARMTVPGSPIEWMWKYRNTPPPDKSEPVKDTAFQDPDGAGDIDTFVRTFAPIDHVTVQPFSDPVFETQGGAAVEIFQAVLQNSPNAQAWIYAQWANQFPTSPDGGGYLTDGMARGAPQANWAPPPQPVAETWEATTLAQKRYHEAFRDYVDERIPGKKVLVIPAGDALVELKTRMDGGRIPGMQNFFGTIFSDYLHLHPPGEYLVSLVFYSCMYRQSPEGRVTYRPQEMTAEQATSFQQIAWETASAYPLSGIVP